MIWSSRKTGLRRVPQKQRASSSVGLDFPTGTVRCVPKVALQVKHTDIGKLNSQDKTQDNTKFGEASGRPSSFILQVPSMRMC